MEAFTGARNQASEISKFMGPRPLTAGRSGFDRPAVPASSVSPLPRLETGGTSRGNWPPGKWDPVRGVVIKEHARSVPDRPLSPGGG